MPTLRKATANDIKTLQTIGKTTFLETFSDDNEADDMQQYVAEKFSHDQLNNEINNEESEFYLAEQDSQTLGYLKVNTGAAQTEIQQENALEIERIYVLQAFQGKKIGQLLYQKAVELAKENNVDFIWLGVWEENPRAIRFYEKNGFTPFADHIFQLGTSKHRDILMKKEVRD